MRVTKAIKEYVEQRICDKYAEKIKQIDNEYLPERQEVIDGLNKILDEANEKAKAFVESKGFAFCDSRMDYSGLYGGYRYHYAASDNVKPFRLDHNPENIEKKNQIEKRKQELSNQKETKIKQILFDLEVGETDKRSLNEILDAVSIE